MDNRGKNEDKMKVWKMPGNVLSANAVTEISEFFRQKYP